MEGHSGDAQVSYELMDGGLKLGIEMSKMVPGFGLSDQTAAGTPHEWGN